MSDFNFDEWMNLHKTDPEEFERRRAETVRAVIDSAPAELQLKLLQLQWKLDGIHRTHTPIGGLLKMQGMMWDSFLEMNSKLQDLAAQIPPDRAQAANDC